MSLRQPVQQDQRLGQVVHGADDLRMFRRQYLAAQRQHRLGQFTRLLKVPLLDQDSDLNAHRRERVGVFLAEGAAMFRQNLLVEFASLDEPGLGVERVGQDRLRFQRGRVVRPQAVAPQVARADEMSLRFGIPAE